MTGSALLVNDAMSRINIDRRLDQLFREEGGRVRAALISRLRDFELAEDVLQEAFLSAIEHWPSEGLPNNPAGWLLVTAQRKAIDRLRRAQVLMQKQAEMQLLVTLNENAVSLSEEEVFPDDRLKLIFTCCHPALNQDAQVALTLQTLGGLSTTEIAHAFLVSETTMAQRLVRAKRKIRNAGIPYSVPAAHQLSERLSGVLLVLYLIFNAGYISSQGESLLRNELCAEAIRLCRALALLLQQVVPPAEQAEALGLLALMLIHDARKEARIGPEGELIILEEQDRSLWDQQQTQEGMAILDQAMLAHKPGPYQLQAAISALHSQAASAEETDWLQISLLYGALIKHQSSPVIWLNWVVAVAMASTPARGLELLAEMENVNMQNYYLFHAARADLLRRNQQYQAARESYQRALALTQNTVEQAFLKRRLAELSTKQIHSTHQ
ncbi:RNA polymerase sigma factor [Dictyobacter formicarum]|uniref:RNA polymerase subunit sigma-24 n=1 Tax=Dictyobacter formicarum TaxID=2778368 RepID=A0ABQ3VDS8_9CHLR|nr:RNA polymerase sigma factor [Dictyobacter formicarum]GHO83914.1 RNA polymerase subunit sigma-24 [Dictyobacter formicarum]